ncbi:hypothetical protein ASPZODRAFT_16449 [Penicilliopsis zonata CBS 506.65]|uniref:HNH nuclease domain-containing protein n=1 Tax=Penicilliopsis zonata CBS 506.65 TaxID=1073090 RepID=A0A1L9SHU4_9EURO|nr:hypothetical protein ASPZODRAFT_16449 [Penicilliopsis zonata CBS 506.65]OJJ46701.1 hypothetical protein ASPZODRAFT_16449 [Penicilliopsis zonata CBS 506.65]
MNAEFEDTRRHDLIKHIAKAMSDARIPFTQAVWATLWLSDLENLQAMVNEPRVMNISTLVADMAYEKIVKPWNTRSCSSAPMTSLELSPEAQLSTSEIPPRINRCKIRDNEQCILTKAGYVVEVAHIYPSSLQGQEAKSAFFWQALRVFWTAERTKRWEKDVFGPNTNTCANLVTMAPHTHAYWDGALFALKPLGKSEDESKMEMQFFWLRPTSLSSPVILDIPPSIPTDYDSSVVKVKLFDCEVDKKLCSGDRIVITTDDPINRPLPSYNLLEMQWVLHRLTALCGEGEIASPSSSDEEGSEGERGSLTVE